MKVRLQFAICSQGLTLLGVTPLIVSDLRSCESEPSGCDLFSRDTLVGSDSFDIE